jgi:putative ABC transport system ATP-binding protein
VNVLKDFSLALDAGQKLIIKGPSGTGKSSLFSLLMGFVRPDSGFVYYNNLPVNGSLVWNIRKQIAYLDQAVSIGSGRVDDFFQSLLNCPGSVQSVPASGPADPGAAAHDKLSELTAYFDFDPGLCKKEISALSGGEKQRTGIIGIILLNRPTLLLDEITAALDPELKRKCARFFINDPHKTALIISHDDTWIQESRACCPGRVMILDMEKRELYNADC